MVSLISTLLLKRFDQMYYIFMNFYMGNKNWDPILKIMASKMRVNLGTYSLQTEDQSGGLQLPSWGPIWEHVASKFRRNIGACSLKISTHSRGLLLPNWGPHCVLTAFKLRPNLGAYNLQIVAQFRRLYSLKSEAQPQVEAHLGAYSL